MSDFVTCPICKKQYKEINTAHLKYRHDMTLERFKSLYPEYSTMSIGTRRHRGQHAQVECPKCRELITKNNFKKHVKVCNGTGTANTYLNIKKCFSHHKKECIICKWDIVVHVHHLDGNRKNRNRENLVPLCPNHHAMIHHPDHKSKIMMEIKQKLES